MKYLIVSTLPTSDQQVQQAIESLQAQLQDTQVIYTQELRISHCLGCNSCWLKTPGICPIKDDYEQLMIGYLQAEAVLFITDTKLGFVSYQTKNLFDRILPLATMYLKFHDGQMRHIARYKKTLKMGVLYYGNAQQTYLNHWLSRTMLNLHGKSLGAYPVAEKEGLYHALGYHQLHAANHSSKQHG